MTTFTTRNVPMVEGTDPADIAARVNPVAQLAHDRPGVSALTTTQRNALTGAELWDGRVILNTTTDRLNRYDLGTTSWVAVADFSEIAALLATSGLPAALAQTASRGVSTSAARADHVHPTAPWVGWTPVWTSTNGTPVVGNGSLAGRYQLVGRTLNFELSLIVGSTTTFGNAGGQWQFTLPQPAFYGFSYVKPLGTVLAVDSGARQYAALAVPVSGSNTKMYLWRDAGASEMAFTPSTPVTWAINDIIGVSGSYEAAV